MKTLKGIMFCAAVLFSSGASAEIRLEMDNINWKGRNGGGYAVFSSEEQSQTIYFRVRSTEASPFFVTFGSSSSGKADGRRKATAQNDELEFTLYDSTVRRTPLKDLPFANASEIIRDAFTNGETEKELSYAILVPPGQIAPPGRYTDILRVNLYRGTPDKYVLSDSKSLLVSIPVDPVTELSVLKAGEGFNPAVISQILDFGTLTRGKARGLDLRVRSNAGYSITIESENRGHLKNVDPRDASVLPYELLIGGKFADVRSHQLKLSRGSRKTDFNGDRHDLQFSIGNIDGATAGIYRDNITITVSSDQ